LSAPTLTEVLNQGIAALGEDPANHPCELYLRFIDELVKWNKAYNLTAIREPELMLTHHILDSLSILPFIHGKRCLDVGTGAGLPGLILALARPDTHWVLLDSKIKKIRFLHHIMREFGLKNVGIAHSRVESYQADQSFTTIVTRAFSSLAKFCEMTTHLKGIDCHLLAMKGEYPVPELAEVASLSVQVQKLAVPGLNAERHLVIIS